MKQTEYDIAIVGGGLGGLSLSILMVRSGFRVALFEKETYPFHRVCGEYISNESLDFVKALGVDLKGIPQINRLAISSIKGRVLQADLPLGGFGISRYNLDHQLAKIASREGIDLFEGARVEQIDFETEAKEHFQIKSRKGKYSARLVVCAYGKKSNLDVKLQRPFAQKKPRANNNYIGVKYHVKHPDFPADLIELMNFKDGYCGMSQIEDGKYCMCYLTTAASLQANGNSIEELEEVVLKQNPLLAERLEHSKRLYTAPVVISNVNFQAKSPVENHLLMMGDAAGSIAPLAGNGMSMSFHAAWMLHRLASDYLSDKITRQQLEGEYAKCWKRHFNTRIKAGARLQGLFGKTGPTELAIGSLRYLPFLTRRLIRLTHGKPFYIPPHS